MRVAVNAAVALRGRVARAVTRADRAHAVAHAARAVPLLTPGRVVVVERDVVLIIADAEGNLDVARRQRLDRGEAVVEELEQRRRLVDRLDVAETHQLVLQLDLANELEFGRGAAARQLVGHAAVLAEGRVSEHTVAKPAVVVVAADSLVKVVLATLGVGRDDLDVLVVGLHVASALDALEHVVKLVGLKVDSLELLEHLHGQLLLAERHLGARIGDVVLDGVRDWPGVRGAVVELALGALRPRGLIDGAQHLVEAESAVQDLLDDHDDEVHAERVPHLAAGRDEDSSVRRAVGAAVVPEDGLVVLAERAGARRHDLIDAEDELVEDRLVVVELEGGA
eukprot:5709454-Prymnesium_polylepis.1